MFRISRFGHKVKYLKSFIINHKPCLLAKMLENVTFTEANEVLVERFTCQQLLEAFPFDLGLSFNPKEVTN